MAGDVRTGTVLSLSLSVNVSITLMAMILAALAIFMALYALRHRGSPLVAWETCVRHEWFSGLCGIYETDEPGLECEDSQWLVQQLRQARRSNALSREAMSLICHLIRQTRKHLDNYNNVRFGLLTRIIVAALLLGLVRTFAPIPEHLVWMDIAAQLAGSILCYAVLIVSSRRLMHHWFWCGGLSLAGRQWLRGVLFDDFDHEEFSRLKAYERLTGIGIKSERLTWLRSHASDGSLQNSFQQNNTQLVLMVFDLVGIGSVWVGGGLVPLLQFI